MGLLVLWTDHSNAEEMPDFRATFLNKILYGDVKTAVL